MVFVMTMTLWSLTVQARNALGGLLGGTGGFDTDALNGVVALVLLALASVLVVEARAFCCASRVWIGCRLRSPPFQGSLGVVVRSSAFTRS